MYTIYKIANVIYILAIYILTAWARLGTDSD